MRLKKMNSSNRGAWSEFMTCRIGIVCEEICLRETREAMWRRGTLGVLALVFSITLPGRTQAPKEPMYEGKSLSQWIALLQESAPERGIAIEVLGEMGPDAALAIPSLIEAL